MSDSASPDPAVPNREEMMSALFAQMVMQQAQMAMMLLGRSPHPQSGETIQDLEGARMFIDQLEMLEVKTRGNLSQVEDNLLKQSLMSLRLAFVEAVQTPAASAPKTERPPPAPESSPATSAAGPADAAEGESRKKFSKKY